jgi:hypothetical protein
MSSSRFSKFFNLRLSHEMFRAVERQACTRQQTVAQYCRDALLSELKRSGVRVRPLTKHTANKQAEAA